MVDTRAQPTIMMMTMMMVGPTLVSMVTVLVLITTMRKTKTTRNLKAMKWKLMKKMMKKRRLKWAVSLKVVVKTLKKQKFKEKKTKI